MKITLPRLFPLLLLLLLVLNGCAAKAFREGKEALLEGEYDRSVTHFQRAAQKRPANNEYQMYLQRARLQAALHHLHKGRQLRETGDQKGGLREFQRALNLRPGMDAAAQEITTTRQAQQSAADYAEAAALVESGVLKEAHPLLAKLLERHPDHVQAQALLKEVEKRLTISGPLIGRLFKNREPMSLEFKRTTLRDAFEILSRLGDITFILDKGIKNENLDLDLKDVSLMQSFELLLNLYNLKAKPLQDKAILIYPDSNEKNKQFDDYKIKTRYLSHISAKQAVNLLRTMLKIKTIFVHEERNALVFRERPEVIQLAEQLLAATDTADSEVLFELELIEVNHSDTLLFGPSLNPYSVSAGLAKGGTVVASGLSAADATTNLVESLSSLDSVYTLPTAVFDFQKTRVDSEILATPKIRVKNREKAKILVGSKEPVITVTTTGETSTDNIQYVDVGVKLDIEPQIQLDGTVVSKLGLEVSSVTEKTTTTNGSLALSISTTTAETTLTLKNGERTVIGGLIRNDNTKTRKVIPLLGDLPLIGRLFTNHNKDKKKREILLSVTTHILRNVDLPDAELTDLWSGGEDNLRPAANFASFLTPTDSSQEAPQKKLSDREQEQAPATTEENETSNDSPTNPLESTIIEEEATDEAPSLSPRASELGVP